ncbi:hypothetical protein BH23CYA1_BH23CYA1_22060 [soil metagenome]
MRISGSGGWQTYSMSLFLLLVTAWIALVLSIGVDALPQLLLGWIHLPNWLLGLSLLSLVAWCIDDGPSAP